MGCGASSAATVREAAERRAEFGTDCVDSGGPLAQQYKVGLKIGRGTFGSCVRAVRNSDGLEVAVKSILKSNRRFKVETVLHEAEMLKAANHPSCLAFYDLIEDEKAYHLVTSIAAGGDVLDRLLDTGKFSESDSICIMRQLMEVLAHLHQNDIVHRDIKPENILLMSRDPKSYDYNRIMICDFGMSQSRPGIETNVLKTMIGTPEFAAPEVMSIARYGCTPGVPDSDKYSCQVDNWAAGCVLFTMLSLSTPFQSNSRTNIPGMIDRILSGKYSFKASVWATISEDTKGLTKSLICVDPRVRLNAKLSLQHPALCQVKGLMTPVVNTSEPWGSTLLLPVRANALASNFSTLAKDGIIDQKQAPDESCSSCVSTSPSFKRERSSRSSGEAHVAKEEMCAVATSPSLSHGEGKYDIRLASNDRASCASVADSWHSAAVTEPAALEGQFQNLMSYPNSQKHSHPERENQ